MKLKHKEVTALKITDNTGRELADVFLPTPLSIKRNHRMKLIGSHPTLEAAKEIKGKISDYVNNTYIKPKLEKTAVDALL